MIRLTTALLTLGFSMVTARQHLLRTGASTALVILKRHGIGFYAGQTHNNKMFAANGHRRNTRHASPAARRGGLNRAMDIVDYLAIGFLTACMIWSAMALYKAR